MASDVRERLCGLGCKSVASERRPISFGAGFLRIKRFEQYRKRQEAVEAQRLERADRRRATHTWSSTSSDR